MGAMNQGVMDVDGKVVGVIHQMFMPEKGTGSKYVEGCHDVFKQDRNAHAPTSKKVQLKIARGDDLQERKRLLVEGADALIVLPGGPGTFDELWEMACGRQVGFVNVPIVCVNVDGYYESFRQMLERAHEDQFLYKLPSDILHFEDTSEKAIEYIEGYMEGKADDDQKRAEKSKKKVIKRKPSMLQRMGSVYNMPFNFSSLGLGGGDNDDDDEEEEESSINATSIPYSYAMTFITGLALGFMLQSRK